MIEEKAYKGFDLNGFMEWLEKTLTTDDYARQTVLNIVDYAHKHEHVGKDQFAYFISDLLPEVQFLDVSRFCEDAILTDDTLRQLGRK